MGTGHRKTSNVAGSLRPTATLALPDAQNRVGRMYLDNSARLSGTALGDRNEALFQGLLLVRASTLKMIRLQLALVRNDRRVALNALDDLVALDHRLHDHLNTIPMTSDELARWRKVDADASALTQEKLTIAAEISCQRTSQTEQARVEEDVTSLQAGDVPHEGEFQEEPPSRRRLWLVIATIVLLTGLVTGGFIVAPIVAPWLGQMGIVLQ